MLNIFILGADASNISIPASPGHYDKYELKHSFTNRTESETVLKILCYLTPYYFDPWLDFMGNLGVTQYAQQFLEERVAERCVVDVVILLPIT